MTQLLNDKNAYGAGWIEVARRLGNYAHPERDAVEIVDLAGMHEKHGALGRVVDAGCGPGHHCAAFLRLGCGVVGIDVSPEALKVAEFLNPGPTYVERDLTLDRTTPMARWLRGSADVVTSLYSSFGYGATTVADQAMLENFRRLLRPGGRLVLHLSDLERSRHRLRGVRTTVRETNGVTETLTVDFATGMLHVRYELDGEIVDSRIRMYERDDLVQMLEDAGFLDIEYYGGFDGRPKRPEDRLVLVAHA